MMNYLKVSGSITSRTHVNSLQQLTFVVGDRCCMLYLCRSYLINLQTHAAWNLNASLLTRRHATLKMLLLHSQYYYITASLLLPLLPLHLHYLLLGCLVPYSLSGSHCWHCYWRPLTQPPAFQKPSHVACQFAIAGLPAAMQQMRTSSAKMLRRTTWVSGQVTRLGRLATAHLHH